MALENGCNNAIIALHKNAAVIGGGVFFGLAAVEVRFHRQSCIPNFFLGKEIKKELGFLQLAGMVLAGCLANSIQNNHRRGYGV